MRGTRLAIIAVSVLLVVLAQAGNGPVKAWDFEAITFWVLKAIETGDWDLPFNRPDRVDYFLGRVDWWQAYGDACADQLVKMLQHR